MYARAWSEGFLLKQGDAAGGLGQKCHRIDSGAISASGPEELLDLRRATGVDERYRTSSESSARHPTTKNSIDVSRRIDDEVKFLARDFVIFTQGSVTAVHAFAGSVPVADIQGVDERECPLVLGDHVP